MNALTILCLAVVAVPVIGAAYEKAFAPTDPGAIEIKTIPGRTLIVSGMEGGYFDENNELFGELFRYIRDNDVSMTVPVKADLAPGKMYFYIGSRDLAKELKDTEAVKVVVEKERTVLSIGVRGGYSEKNFTEARNRLFDRLAVSKEWKKSGDAYAIFWNSPFVPAFMKRFEVHVPVEPVPPAKEPTGS